MKKSAKFIGISALCILQSGVIGVVPSLHAQETNNVQNSQSDAISYSENEYITTDDIIIAQHDLKEYGLTNKISSLKTLKNQYVSQNIHNGLETDAKKIVYLLDKNQDWKTLNQTAYDNAKLILSQIENVSNALSIPVNNIDNLDATTVSTFEHALNVILNTPMPYIVVPEVTPTIKEQLKDTTLIAPKHSTNYFNNKYLFSSLMINTDDNNYRRENYHPVASRVNFVTSNSHLINVFKSVDLINEIKSSNNKDLSKLKTQLTTLKSAVDEQVKTWTLQFHKEGTSNKRNFWNKNKASQYPNTYDRYDEYAELKNTPGENLSNGVETKYWNINKLKELQKNTNSMLSAINTNDANIFSKLNSTTFSNDYLLDPDYLDFTKSGNEHNVNYVDVNNPNSLTLNNSGKMPEQWNYMATQSGFGGWDSYVIDQNAGKSNIQKGKTVRSKDKTTNYKILSNEYYNLDNISEYEVYMEKISMNNVSSTKPTNHHTTNHQQPKSTLSIQGHFGHHSKNIGKGLNKRGTKINLNAHGFHVHGKAQLSTRKIHGKTVEYIRGILADKHYKITSIKLVKSHNNLIAHVYVRKA